MKKALRITISIALLAVAIPTIVCNAQPRLQQREEMANCSMAQALLDRATSEFDRIPTATPADREIFLRRGAELVDKAGLRVKAAADNHTAALLSTRGWRENLLFNKHAIFSDQLSLSWELGETARRHKRLLERSEALSKFIRSGAR